MILVRWWLSSWMQFSSLFLKCPWHGPTTDNRSDEFHDRWLPSNHSTYGVCERKQAIQIPPKKKSHVERLGERLGHGMFLKWEMRCLGNMFWTMVIDLFAKCAMAPSCWNHTLAQFILLRRSPHPRPTYWVLPIQKMSGSCGSPSTWKNSVVGHTSLI